MGMSWKMRWSSIGFWQFNYEESPIQNTPLRSGLQQMPADDFEALQGKNDSVFRSGNHRNPRDSRKKKYDVYAIVGEGIDDEFYPMDDAIDWTKTAHRYQLAVSERGLLRLESSRFSR